MYGYSVIETLDFEIVNIQILDNYLKNGKVRLSNCFIEKNIVLESNSIKDTMDKLGIKKSMDDEYDDRLNGSYSIDDVLALLVADLDIYSSLYKVPPVKISNVEWELLFYQLAKYYHNRSIDDFFLKDMIYLNKMAISKAMVYDDNCINLETYLWSLRYLESDIITERNLIDIVSQLSTTFGINVLSLLENDEGEIGCLKKDIIFETDATSNDTIAKILLEKGYEIEDASILEKDTKVSCNRPKQKIVNLSDYRNSKK